VEYPFGQFGVSCQGSMRNKENLDAVQAVFSNS